MTRKVNIHYIKRLFDPLFELDDKDTDNLNKLDLNDEVLTKDFIKKYLLDNFNRYGPQSKLICKNTLNYLLCLPKHTLKIDQIYPLGELPFLEPNNATYLVTWIWEILFPNESWSNCADNNFVINNDYSAPNSSFIK